MIHLVGISVTISCFIVSRLVIDAARREAEIRAQQAETLRAEAERRAEENRFQATLLGTVEEALVAAAPDGTILYWNRGAELLLGGTTEERVGRPLQLEGSAFREQLRLHLLRGEAFAGEVQLDHPQRGRVPALVRSWPFTDVQGRPAGSIGVIVDLADLRHAEQSLRESERRLRQAKRVARLAVWEWDITSDVVTWSGQLCQILGMSPQEYTGQIEDLFQAIHPEDRETESAWINGALLRAPLYEQEAESPGGTGAEAGTEQVLREFRMLRRDGSVSWVRGDAVAVRASDSAPARVLGVMVDVTEQRRLDERLRQGQKMEALGQMASGVAHDFNNAMTVIVGAAEILEMRADLLRDEAEVRRHLRMISMAAEDAQTVVHRLREIYRPNVDGIPFQAVDLARVAADGIELTRPRWQAQTQAAGVHINVQLDLQPTPAIHGSASELREALTNLVFNATDAMPDGGTLTVRTYTEGGQAVLSVGDSGVGMPPEVRERCLEPFYTTKGEHGSGLGLGMVYGTVLRHKGDMVIESTVGAGSTIRLLLPLATQVGSALSTSPTESDVRRLRILLADDNPRIIDLLRAYLAVDGHVVESALGAREAIAKLRAAPFDVLITDRAMPIMSGDQLASIAKGLAPQTAILMLTGFAEIMDADGDAPDGVDLVLGKPVRPDALRASIAALTNKIHA